MPDKKFIAWFSDVGFVCRVLIIADMMDEVADAWGAASQCAFREAIAEARETANLELDRFQGIGGDAGYLDPGGLERNLHEGEGLLDQPLE